MPKSPTIDNLCATAHAHVSNKQRFCMRASAVLKIKYNGSLTIAFSLSLYPYPLIPIACVNSKQINLRLPLVDDFVASFKLLA